MAYSKTKSESIAKEKLYRKKYRESHKEYFTKYLKCWKDKHPKVYLKYNKTAKEKRDILEAKRREEFLTKKHNPSVSVKGSEERCE